MTKAILALKTPANDAIDFYTVFEQADCGMLVLDRRDIIVHANPGICRLLGYPASQLQNRPYSEFITAGNNPARCRRADGTMIHGLLSSAPLPDTGRILLIQALPQEPGKESQHRELEALMDTLPMPVFFKDKSLYYRRANRAACDFLGLSPEQITGRSGGELFPANVAEQILDQDGQAIYRKALCITPDTPLADAGGNLHYFSSYKLPVLDDDGQVSGLLDLMLDVTERKLAESERLTQLQSQRDALVQEVHHRIKNHLQGVVGLLQRAISINPTLAEPLRGVSAQVESIAGIHGLQSRLRGQYLKFGQVAAMIAELTPETVAVGGDGQEVTLPHQEAVPFALSLNELVSNALKHRLKTTSESPVNIELIRQPPNLIIRISSGPATLPSEFDFNSGKGLGTGLRLLKTLLPNQGACLDYFELNGYVVAELQLMPPLINPLAPVHTIDPPLN